MVDPLRRIERKSKSMSKLAMVHFVLGLPNIQDSDSQFASRTLVRGYWEMREVSDDFVGGYFHICNVVVSIPCLGLVLLRAKRKLKVEMLLVVTTPLNYESEKLHNHV